jgi:3D (Asp-Asp-Asp) domain-containing protein
MKSQPVKKTLVGLAISLSIAGFAIPANAAQASGTYVTHANDTFWKVSKKLNIRLDDLLAANPAIDPLNVYEGLTFKLPSSRVTRVSAAEQTPEQNAVKTSSGKTMQYNKVITGVATAYSEAPQENGWGPVDYYGNALQIGTIAVDPKVIPLGTKVYITGYTFAGLPRGLVATATDKGSAIHGNRIDIFIPSSAGKADDFGIQNVKIYVLK